MSDQNNDAVYALNPEALKAAGVNLGDVPDVFAKLDGLLQDFQAGADTAFGGSNDYIGGQAYAAVGPILDSCQQVCTGLTGVVAGHAATTVNAANLGAHVNAGATTVVAGAHHV
ncbi:hypothetical protein SAMN05892883_4179 [Jatrophihabitans sp. GAS493]|uniref:hypothetical protein n=1 Tax=Jatrophihabitans sp. GAS493 TaxID=1907575 RepID=UPI000BB891D3|nr:hypothetical protein [Jatrophihabitans sp. GAS493]SOD74982.1 hypothetical protein SAMN05892883_4179 [Jatrophihabitans sp. GAS493]